MSAHTKGHPTKYIDVRVASNGKECIYHIPDTNFTREQLSLFFKELDAWEVTPWKEATPWEILAKDRIEKYKKSGLVLRGARYRENMSQLELERKSGVGQNEISKIENGKRGVGKVVAQKLAKALNFDYRLLLENNAETKKIQKKN